MELQWEEPGARGAAVQGYRVRVSVVDNGVSKELESTGVKQTTYMLRQIQPNTDYAVQVEVSQRGV